MKLKQDKIGWLVKMQSLNLYFLSIAVVFTVHSGCCQICQAVQVNRSLTEFM